MPSKGVAKHHMLVWAEAAVPPNLALGCSHMCKALSTTLTANCRKDPMYHQCHRCCCSGDSKSSTTSCQRRDADSKGQPLPSQKGGAAFLGRAELPLGCLAGEEDFGLQPWAAPVYAAHLASSFSHQLKAKQELMSSTQGLLQA